MAYPLTPGNEIYSPNKFWSNLLYAVALYFSIVCCQNVTSHEDCTWRKLETPNFKNLGKFVQNISDVEHCTELVFFVACLLRGLNLFTQKSWSNFGFIQDRQTDRKTDGQTVEVLIVERIDILCCSSSVQPSTQHTLIPTFMCQQQSSKQRVSTTGDKHCASIINDSRIRYAYDNVLSHNHGKLSVSG